MKASLNKDNSIEHIQNIFEMRQQMKQLYFVCMVTA
jgi:hypothetical protein